MRKLSRRLVWSLIVVLGIAASPVYATTSFTINPTFTAGFVTNFGANAIAAENAFNAAAAIFTGAFDNPIAVNITVNAVAGTGTLGASSTPVFSIAWSSLDAAVVANDTGPLGGSSAQLTSIGPGGSITAADPSGGAGTFWITRADRKALGLLASDGANDGTITVGTGFSYTFNNSGGVAPGTIDLEGVFAHEISEVMGRIGISGGSIGGIQPSYTLLDALSYSGAGTRGLGNGAGNFFSIDAGTHLLKAFNNQAGLGGDSRDWASGANDAFNAFSSSGVVNGVTLIDLEEMNVLGYDLATPEPATFGLVGGVLVAVSFLRRRLRK